MRRITSLTICLFLLGGTAVYAADPVISSQVSSVSNAAVKLAVLPAYPKRALRKGIDGEATVAFTISRYGRAIDPRIVSATPRKVFEKEVLDTIRYWIFDPARPVNCGTVEQTATQTFRFRHDSNRPVQIMPLVVEGVPTLPRPQQHADSMTQIRLADAAARNLSQAVNPRGLVPVDRVEPDYPEEALRRNVEGVVSVSFVIEKDGSVSEPVVVDAVRGSVFKGEALRALRRWKFEPSLRDGEAELRTGCHEFIFLADEYKRRQSDKAKREASNIRVFDTR
ncbi:MAG: energy transducer TonB [Gammaproteobacteria bacterium]|nr:energy transducer TonB [Gammaproteobacteria bacterium]